MQLESERDNTVKGVGVEGRTGAHVTRGLLARKAVVEGWREGEREGGREGERGRVCVWVCV